MQDENREKIFQDEKKQYQLFWRGVESLVKINEQSLLHDDVYKVSKQLINIRANLESTWLFDPNKSFKIQWDLFVGFLIIYSVITVPFKIAFEVFDSTGMTAVVTLSFIHSNSLLYSFILLKFIGR